MFRWKWNIMPDFYYYRKMETNTPLLYLVAILRKIFFTLLVLIIVSSGYALAQYHIWKRWPNLPPGELPDADSVERQIESRVDDTLGKLLRQNPALAQIADYGLLREAFSTFGNEMLSLGCLQAKEDTDPAARRPKLFQPFLSSLPPIYIITPTYPRPVQIPELTRLAQTLMHVDNIFWLVIEDAIIATPLVTKFLIRTGIPFEHLTAPMPDQYKGWWNPPRGVSNRNRGLSWLRANASTGVFYFADDDNTYDIKLFEEMRTTEKVAMWPVGLCTDFGISTPIVVNGIFEGFYDGWVVNRKFPVDMAGFAVSVKFLLQRPNAILPFVTGYEEDAFLKSLAPFEPNEIELKAGNCTEILVWHTQTVKVKPSLPLEEKYNNTNLAILKQLIV